jgi:hypothetical protein
MAKKAKATARKAPRKSAKTAARKGGAKKAPRRAAGAARGGSAKRATKRVSKTAAKAKKRPGTPARSATKSAGTTGRKSANTEKSAKTAKRANTAKSGKAAKRGQTAKSGKAAKRAQSPAVRDARSAARSRPDAASARRPNLDRDRRVVTEEEEMVPSPPSSLNMDRTASAARTGRAEYEQRLRNHTSTGPAMTGGDIDADWEDAEAVGDEAPGGDNPTPDQDIVDEIGRAVGLEYDDDEELKGADKVIERDRHRWELDPRSKDDFEDE